MRVWALCSSAATLLLLHLPLLVRPYFWDEAGQFIPAALDIYHSGDLVPRSTIPNVHPPGIMLWLAAAWHLFGYSIVTARMAMLLIAALGCWWVYRLAAEFLCPDRRAAWMTLALLCLSPLFFSQSVMALLDMPAMTLTALALLLFLRQRFIPAALACAALVMVKETGALLPAVLGIVLAREHRWKESVWFLLPGLPLLAWLFLLHSRTGHWFGNAVFAQYNLTYPLNPVRLSMAVLRRGYYLFVGSGYFIGTWALVKTRDRRQWSRPWFIVGIFALAHFVAMCVIGGAVLERYLLPILPLTLAVFANAICSLQRAWRNAAFAGLCACSATCILVNPIYPFPLENNLAWTAFVDVQHDAAEYLSTHLPAGSTIASSFPFAGCLRRSELGYTSRVFRIEEVPDFTKASLGAPNLKKVDALVIFSSTWDPLGLMQNTYWLSFLQNVYDFEPDVAPAQIPALLGLRRAARFTRHGQWIEVFQP